MKPKIEFYRNKIVMPIKNGEVASYYSDLMYIKYKDSYCWLFFSGGQKYSLDISLAELLKNLPQKPFFRCKRTEVVNLCYYSEFRENPAVLILEYGSEFSLSVRTNKGLNPTCSFFMHKC